MKIDMGKYLLEIKGLNEPTEYLDVRAVCTRCGAVITDSRVTEKTAGDTAFLDAIEAVSHRCNGP